MLLVPTGRAKVEEMTAGTKSSQLPQQAPAATAAVVQHFEDQMSLNDEGPLNEVSGDTGRTLAHFPMTPAILRRGHSLDTHPERLPVATINPPRVRFEDVQDEGNEACYNGMVAPAKQSKDASSLPSGLIALPITIVRLEGGEKHTIT